MRKLWGIGGLIGYVILIIAFEISYGGFLNSMSSSPPARPVKNFRKAKIYLTEIYKTRPYTFYCACEYAEKVINYQDCSYKPVRPRSRRAKRLEWEHVVPISWFARQFNQPRCPRSTRRCLRKYSPAFNRIEADLYNLVPSIGEINARRSNKKFGYIWGEWRRFGKCDLEINDKTLEPPPEIRGDIARIALYMIETHGLSLSRVEISMFWKWHNIDPVTQAECLLWEKIYAIQGNKHPFANLCEG